MPQIVNIAIDRLFPHSDNPRKDLGDLSELAASIKASGILQNLTVVPDEPDNSNTDFTIIIGHRRYAAAKIAGLTELPCVVVEMSEREQLQTMLVENMQRSDLTVYEQAQGFQMMLNMGDSVAEIAEKSGFSQTTIRRRVKLLDLDRQKFQKAEARGATLNDYLELDKLDSPEDKNKALDAIGTANFNSVLKSLISEQEIRKKFAEWTEIADKFAYQIERTGEFNGQNVGMVYCDGYHRWDLKREMTVPEDANDVRYHAARSHDGRCTRTGAGLRFVFQSGSVRILRPKRDFQLGAALCARDGRCRLHSRPRQSPCSVGQYHPSRVRADFLQHHRHLHRVQGHL